MSLSPQQIDELNAYIGLMAKYNRSLNLTSLPIDPPSTEAIDRLLVEPTIAGRLISPSETSMVDIGSGGGSPAIPLKIAAPWIELVMVEVKARKAAFLRDVVRQLGLSGTSVANERVEDYASRPSRAGSADVVSIRAVRADADLWQVVSLLLKPQGRVLWFGGHADSNAYELWSLKLVSSESLPGAATLAVLERQRL